MPFTYLFSAIEPGLGRVNADSLTDQICVELLIEGFTEFSKARYKDRHGDFADVCRWRGVECDANESVVKLDLKARIETTLFLSYIPTHVTYFRVVNSFFGQDCTSELDLRFSHSNIETIMIEKYGFSGTVDLLSLPEKVIEFSILRNNFTGNCDFTRLPSSLQRLDLSFNQFSGSVVFDSLPHTLQTLRIASNMFCGTPNLDSLPPRLSVVSMDSNDFRGVFQLLHPPDSLRTVYASMNRFSGSAVVQSDCRANIHLHGSKVARVIDENGTPHKDAEGMLKFYL